MKWKRFIIFKVVWVVLVTALMTGASGCRNNKEDIINEAAELEIPVGVYDAFVLRYSKDLAKQASWIRVDQNLWEARFMQGAAPTSVLINPKGVIVDSGSTANAGSVPQVAYDYLKANYPTGSIHQIYAGQNAQTSTGYRVLLIGHNNSYVTMVEFSNTGAFVREVRYV